MLLLAALGLGLFYYGLNHFARPDALTGSVLIALCGVVFGWLLADTPAAKLLERVREPSVRGRRITAAVVGLLGGGHVIFSNVYLGRSLLPYWHDDQMHAVQARMMAEGHFLLPAHPMADFFETFHVFVKPVYAGIHFLGTTLLNAPGLKAGFPTWVVPILLASLAVALTYRVVTELIDGLSGLVAALLLVSLDFFRFIAPRILSHGTMLTLGLLLVWMFLRWRRRPGYGWSVAFGLTAGLTLITRPLDAAAYLAPLGLAMLFTRSGPTTSVRLRHALVAAVCTLPFAGVQLYFDKQVTGRWLYSPYQLYNDLNYPGINFDARRQLVGQEQIPDTPSTLPQKRAYYNDFLLTFVRGVRASSLPKHIIDDRLMWTLRHGTPDALLYFLIPIGLLGLRTAARIAFVAIPFVYMAVYVPHYFYLAHYATIIAPSLSVLVLLGVRELATAWPGRSRRIEFAGLMTVTIAALSSMPPFSTMVADDAGPEMPDAAYANERLPSLVRRPALVLFHYDPGVTFHDEPVYNFERAWPDDESIVRAQDLGPRNPELFRYYARSQPDRTVYLFDRRQRRLIELGNVKKLADAATTGPATQPQ